MDDDTLAARDRRERTAMAQDGLRLTGGAEALLAVVVALLLATVGPLALASLWTWLAGGG
jgi:hypothetical protein